jgi:hypothetical protein
MTGCPNCSAHFLKSKNNSIYYYSPMVIRIIGKTKSRFRAFDCSLLSPEDDACRPCAWHRQLVSRVNECGI